MTEKPTPHIQHCSSIEDPRVNRQKKCVFIVGFCSRVMMSRLALATNKISFSRAIEKYEWISNSRLRKQERGAGQRRFLEHAIGDEEHFNRHIDVFILIPTNTVMVSGR